MFCLQFAVACASGVESAMAWFHTFGFDMRIRGVRKQTFIIYFWMIPDLYEMQGTIYWVLGFTRHYRRLPGSSGIYGEFLRNPQVWNLGRKIRRPKKCMAWGGQKINESNPAFHTYKKHPSSKMNDRVIYYNHNILQLCLIHRFTFI